MTRRSDLGGGLTDWSGVATVLTLLGAGLLVVLLFPLMVIEIPAGHRGVMFRRFGGGVVLDQVWKAGVHVIPPWNQLTSYQIRKTQKTMVVPVLTREGLTLNLEISFRYHPRTETLGYLHEFVGPDYLDRILIPQIQALVRSVAGNYSLEEIYGEGRKVLPELLRGGVRQIQLEEYLILDDLLLRAIQLPRPIKIAIELKLEQKQLALSYDYRIQRARKEAIRKRIEGEGIRAFQRVVGEGVSEGLLRWRGIEATQKLAASPNAKIVIIGGGSNGLPLILNTGDPLPDMPLKDAPGRNQGGESGPVNDEDYDGSLDTQVSDPGAFGPPTEAQQIIDPPPASSMPGQPDNDGSPAVLKP